MPRHIFIVYAMENGKHVVDKKNCECMFERQFAFPYTFTFRPVANAFIQSHSQVRSKAGKKSRRRY